MSQNRKHVLNPCGDDVIKNKRPCAVQGGEWKEGQSVDLKKRNHHGQHKVKLCSGQNGGKNCIQNRENMIEGATKVIHFK